MAWRLYDLAIVRDVIGEVEDLLFGDRTHHVRHGAVVAVAAVVLVFRKRLVEVILALIGKPRHVLLAGEIGVVAAVAAVRLRKRQALLHACGIADIARWLRLWELGGEG